MSAPKQKIRVDKWLWQARFVKTRSLAAKLVSAGHVRVNGEKVAKHAYGVGDGDVLTFPQGDQIKVVRLIALGARRGPATEAQTLYEDMTPVPEPEEVRPRGGARPSKRDRRVLDRILDRFRDAQ